MNFTDRQRRALAGTLIAIVGLIAYANTFSGLFVWDDASSILQHRTVQDPSQFLQLFAEDQHAYGRGQGNFYRPLVAASFMLDFAIAYDGPPPGESIPNVSPLLFHLTSAAWHVAAALLLFAVMLRVGAPFGGASLVALVYVLHPLHTEAVAYISGRADSMSAAFMFAGLWCALSRRPLVGIALSTVCFVGALLSKESSFIYPVLLALCLWGQSRAEDQAPIPRSIRFAPFFLSLIVLGGYAAARVLLLSFGNESATAASPIASRGVETLQSFALYIGLLFVPTGLHMERTLDNVGGGTAVAGAVLLISCAGVVVYALRQGNRRAALGMAWFLGAWLPISGLFPLNAPMAEHWMYVPMAGFLWALAELARPLLATPGLPAIATAAVLAWSTFLMGATVERNRDWHDNETLFRDTLEKNPNTLRVRHNLAVTYDDLIGNRIGARREYEGFLTAYEARAEANDSGAAEFDQAALEVRVSLGRIYLADGRVGEAQVQFAKTLQSPLASFAPTLAGEAAFGLGRCYLVAGNREAATELFKEAAKVRPDLQAEMQRMLAGGSPLP